MKPMKDLFLLPVDGLGYEGYQLLIDHEFGHVSTNQAAAHAAHAVNHVDALADALEKAIEIMRGDGMDGYSFFGELESTLNAYRGEA